MHHDRIERAIENLYGIQLGLFPPFKAFDVLVKEEISRLEAPIIKCIDLVVGELSNAVQICTQSVSDSMNVLPFNIVTNDFHLLFVLFRCQFTQSFAIVFKIALCHLFSVMEYHFKRTFYRSLKWNQLTQILSTTNLSQTGMFTFISSILIQYIIFNISSFTNKIFKYWR